MTKYYAEWTGEYPNLCHGEWRLYRNEKELNVEIPFQGSPADTFGVYSEWWFENWSEVFGDYEDGLSCKEWCEEYQEWLSKIAPEQDWNKIFEAFQENDWRYGECGGCI